MESIILTIVFAMGVSSPQQLLEKVTQSFMDINQAQLFLDSLEGMDLSESDQAKYYLYQGWVYGERNDISNAIINYREAIRYFASVDQTQSGNKSDLFYYQYHSAHVNIGRLYYFYNNQELAIEHYKEAMKYAPKNELPHVYYCIGLSQSKMGNAREAIDNLLESFKLSIEYEVSEYRMKSQIELGFLLQKNGNYQESKERLNSVLMEDNLSPTLEAQTRNILGITTWKLKDYGTAEYNFIHIVEKGTPRNQFVGLQNLCEMYLEQGFLYKSIEAGTRAEKQYGDQINSPENAMLFSFLSNAYLAIDDNERALEYSNKFRDYMVTYYEQQQETLESGDAYRIKVVTENYEKELKVRDDRKKSIQANIAVTSIILITFLSFLWRQQYRKRKLVKKIAEELLA